MQICYKIEFSQLLLPKIGEKMCITHVTKGELCSIFELSFSKKKTRDTCYKDSLFMCINPTLAPGYLRTEAILFWNDSVPHLLKFSYS